MTEKKPATKRAPRKAAAKAQEEAPQQQVPASAPVRLEVRLNGKIRYADTVYGPTFDVTDTNFTVTATLQPTMVDAPQLAPPTVFAQQNDVRDGEDFIARVHSGRRDLPQQDAPRSEWPAGSPQAEQEEAQAVADSEDGVDESGDDD